MNLHYNRDSFMDVPNSRYFVKRFRGFGVVPIQKYIYYTVLRSPHVKYISNIDKKVWLKIQLYIHAYFLTVYIKALVRTICSVRVLVVGREMQLRWLSYSALSPLVATLTFDYVFF